MLTESDAKYGEVVALFGVADKVMDGLCYVLYDSLRRKLTFLNGNIRHVEDALVAKQFLAAILHILFYRLVHSVSIEQNGGLGLYTL